MTDKVLLDTANGGEYTPPLSGDADTGSPNPCDFDTTAYTPPASTAVDFSVGEALPSTKVTSLSAVLESVGESRVVGLDAALITTLTRAVSFDSSLSKTLTSTSALDAVLRAPLPVAVLDAAILKQGISNTVSLDAAVLSNIVKSTSLDSAIQSTVVASVNLDSRLIFFVRADNTAVYSIRVAAANTGTYGELLQAEFVSVSGNRFQVANTSTYALLATLVQDNKSVYDITIIDVVRAENKTSYAMSVSASNVTPYSVGTRVISDNSTVYTLAVNVRAGNTGQYSLSLRDMVKASFKAQYALISTELIDTSGVPTVTFTNPRAVPPPAGPSVLDVLEADISTDEGSFGWQASISIADPEVFSSFLIDDPLTLNFFGETFDLVVESKTIERSDVVGVSLRLECVSKSVSHSAPRALPFTKTYDTAMLASDIANDLVQQNVPSETVDWQMVDWILPANRVGISNGEPISLLQRLVESAGGTLDANPDGSLVARPLFPVDTTGEFFSAEADAELVVTGNVFVDDADNISISESSEVTRLFNKFRITEVSTSASDVLDFKFDTIIDEEGEETFSQTDGSIRAFPSPFRTDIEIKHSQDSTLGFSFVGIGTEQVDELLEVKEGIAIASKPIESLVSHSYEATDLGSPTFVQGDRQFITPDVDKKYSLLQVGYITKFITYDVTGIPDLNVQFRLVDGVLTA